jgi:NAD+ diphosphatase
MGTPGDTVAPRLSADEDMSKKQQSISHIYAGNPLDRGERERRDEDWLADKAKDPGSKFLPMWDLKVLISNGSEHGLGWLGLDGLGRLGIEANAIFLGLRGQEACFAVDITKSGPAVRELQESQDWIFEDARKVTEYLSGSDSGIVAQARAQISWHSRNGYCSICGHETHVKRGGHVRQCSKCDTEHYPRTDPVVITVVSHEDRCLLGQSRGRLSRENRYSALAGFVDQGESIEEAVAREIMEEAGIKIGNIHYHSSQPWPFPSSLMIGCHADAVTTDIAMDDEEMADVRWFPRDEVLLALEGKSENLTIPGPIAIAHHLIKAWATEGRP